MQQHQFIKDLQANPKVQARLQRDKEIEARTLHAVQGLLNDLEAIPGVGKLVFRLTTENDEFIAEVGVKREDQPSLIQQPVS
jgi:hypothetical protein